MRPSFVIAVIPHGSEPYLQALTLRSAVLREPLGMRLCEADLAREHDTSYTHIAAMKDNEVVGTVLMIKQDDGRMRMRQFAVSPGLQKQGLGGQLIAFAEDRARDLDAVEIKLNARISAVGFYEKMGYERVGNIFIEHTIPHIYMRKSL